MTAIQMASIGTLRSFDVRVFGDASCESSPLVHVASVADGGCNEVDQGDLKGFVKGRVDTEDGMYLYLDVFHTPGCPQHSLGDSYKFSCQKCQPLVLTTDGVSQDVFYSADCA